VRGQFDAIHAGHADVDQRQIRRIVRWQRLQRVERLMPVGCFADHAIGQFGCDVGQQGAQTQAGRRLVVGDEDAQFGRPVDHVAAR